MKYFTFRLSWRPRNNQNNPATSKTSKLSNKKLWLRILCVKYTVIGSVLSFLVKWEIMHPLFPVYFNFLNYLIQLKLTSRFVVFVLYQVITFFCVSNILYPEKTTLSSVIYSWSSYRVEDVWLLWMDKDDSCVR